MNHKEFVSAIASRMNIKRQEAERHIEATVQVFTENLSAGNTIGINNFGNFEIKKKDERISVHPATQQRTLIPPKLVVNFKQSNYLKEITNKAR